MYFLRRTMPVTLISKGGVGVSHSKRYLALLFLINLHCTSFPYLAGTVYSKTLEKMKTQFLHLKNWDRLGISFLAQRFIFYI